jgi:membrane-associated protein
VRLPHRQAHWARAVQARRLTGIGLPVVGYFLGNIPFVSRHLELIVTVIAVASALPVIASAAAAFIRRRREVEAS